MGGTNRAGRQTKRRLIVEDISGVSRLGCVQHLYRRRAGWPARLLPAPIYRYRRAFLTSTLTGIGILLLAFQSAMLAALHLCNESNDPSASILVWKIRGWNQQRATVLRISRRVKRKLFRAFHKSANLADRAGSRSLLCDQKAYDL
jgi:hypothetical protein